MLKEEIKISAKLLDLSLKVQKATKNMHKNF